MTRDSVAEERLNAIWADRLADDGDKRATAVCAAIGAATAAEVERAVSLLHDHGLDAEPVDDPGRPAQRRSAAISVASARHGLAAANVLAEIGYRPWDPIAGAAETIHARFRSNLVLARTTDATTVLDVQWPRPSGPAGRVPGVLIPNENDYELVSLPARLWPLYLLIRPLRLAAARLGLGRRNRHRLGPFLGTPQSLISPLLELADASAADVVVDLGCGDGRVVVEASSSLGCHAIGVESNPELAAQARERVAQADVIEGSVTIVEGDAMDLERFVDRGTVFFVFVPAEVAVQLIGRLLEVATPGARIVAHEQHRLPQAPPGAVVTPLIVDDAVTVAHCWTVGGASS